MRAITTETKPTQETVCKDWFSRVEVGNTSKEQEERGERD